MARRPRHEEHENHERWLVSYADFITLLFAFFTSMYAISNLDLKKAGRLVMSMQAAFNSPVLQGGASLLGPPQSQSLSPIPSIVPPLDGSAFEGPETADAAGAARAEEPPPEEAGGAGAAEPPEPAPLTPAELDAALAAWLETVKPRLESSLRDAGLEGQVSVRRVGHELLLTLNDTVLFDSASAELRVEAYPTMESIARVLASIPLYIRIEGHTDILPIRNRRFPSNWELSSARATTLLTYLVEREGFDPTRLAAVGYGPYRPADTNETSEGRARNRRVEFVLTGAVAGDASRIE